MTTFQAAGQTPAIEVIGWVASGTAPYPMSDSLILPDKESVNPALIQTKTTLNPGTFTTLPVTAVALNQANFDAIKNQRTNRLYIWGKMNYTDVFGCKRWFTYCLTINDLTSPPPRGETCPRYSDMEGPAGECLK